MNGETASSIGALRAEHQLKRSLLIVSCLAAFAGMPAQGADMPPASLIGTLASRCLKQPGYMVLESTSRVPAIVDKIRFKASNPTNGSGPYALTDADRANNISFRFEYEVSFVYKTSGQPDWKDGEEFFYAEIRDNVLDFSQGVGRLSDEWCRYRWRLKP